MRTRANGTLHAGPRKALSTVADKRVPAMLLCSLCGPTRTVAIPAKAGMQDYQNLDTRIRGYDK